MLMSYILAGGLRGIKAFLFCSEKFTMSFKRTVVLQSKTLSVLSLRLLMFYCVCVEKNSWSCRAGFWGNTCEGNVSQFLYIFLLKDLFISYIYRMESTISVCKCEVFEEHLVSNPSGPISFLNNANTDRKASDSVQSFVIWTDFVLINPLLL